MREHTHDAHTTRGKTALSPQDQQERKQRVLTQGTPAIVHSIADALVIKRENIFLLTEPDGSVPLADDHGLGLYCHDRRYLNGCELKLDGVKPHVLVSTAERSFMAVLQLTNPDIRMPNGQLIRKEQIGVKWERVLEADRPALHDIITLQNFGLEHIEFPLSLAFQAGFEDVYAVRELLPEQLDTLRQASWQEGALSFIYAGKDGIYRGLVITFVPEVHTDGATHNRGRSWFTGWGIRTLSAQERRYNPIGDHLGTVWPHDNAVIAAGFRRYGYDEAARRVFAAIVEAAMHIAHYRWPELFAGFRREEYGVPVHYPVACHPQAWAAATVPYLVEVVLGLVPEAFDQRLRIVRPMLPDFVDRMEVQGLKVGDAQVNLKFERISDGVAVKVLHVDGPLGVIIEPETSMRMVLTR